MYLQAFFYRSKIIKKKWQSNKINAKRALLGSHLSFFLIENTDSALENCSDALFFYSKTERRLLMMANKRQRKKYKRLSFNDRKKIEKLNESGRTVDEIAMIIGVHSATMYREFKRGGEPYKAEVAQRSI